MDSTCIVVSVSVDWGFTSCEFDLDFVDAESEVEDDAVRRAPQYDRLDEVKKACSKVISSATELKIDDNVIDRIKNEIFFNNGDWEQEGTNAPLLPFDDRPPRMSSSYDYELYNASRLMPPYKLVSFKLTDVSSAHRSKRTVAVNGYLYFVITSSLPLATMSERVLKGPEFSMWSQHSQLLISLQGVYAESRKNGGEKMLCLLGSTMLPSRQPDSSDSGSSDNQPTLLQDEQILIVLNIPKKASLKNRAIQGEVRSLNSKTSPKYFDKVKITSQMQANARDYEFNSDEIIAKACNPYPYSDTSISSGIEPYKGADFCSTLKKNSINGAFVVVPHWQCNGTDEFCSKFGPFASDKQINSTDGSFKDVRILVHNIVCVTKKTRMHNGRFLSFDECNNMKEFVNLEDRYNGPRYGPTPRATRIVGSCNGVLCLFDSDLFEFVLWNPVTNHYHLAGGLELNYVPNDDVTSVGFGYISSIDDYKIEARVYRDEKSHIVGLNLVSGLLTKVQLPNLLTRNFDAKVFEIKGSLSLCCTMYDHGRRHTTRVYDVWTLKNNGDGNSWEKSFSINIKGLTLLYIFETGKCLVTRNSNQLMLFDPNEATSSSSTEGDGEVAAIWQRRKRSRGNLSNFYHKAIADVWNYTESLISPCGIFACGE
uniref:DUF2921 domain-containing protein n=1 Tax=Chenopodium quinoa TaxID=63459 RepID=A0A803LMX5_CHEQI